MKMTSGVKVAYERYTNKMKPERMPYPAGIKIIWLQEIKRKMGEREEVGKKYNIGKQ